MSERTESRRQWPTPAEHARRVSAATAARHQRPAHHGQGRPTRAINPASACPSHPAPIFNFPGLLLRPQRSRRAPAAPSSFAVVSRALRRTNTASISPIAAPHLPPPPRRVDCFYCALVRAYFLFPSRWNLGRHGRLHGKLATVRLARASLSILSVSIGLGCVLAGAMMSPRLVVPPAWNVTTSAAAF